MLDLDIVEFLGRSFSSTKSADPEGLRMLFLQGNRCPDPTFSKLA